MNSALFAARVKAAFEQYQALPALRLESGQFSYSELLSAAADQAQFLRNELPAGPVAILASRSFEAYVGILAAVLAERAFVPLQPRFPLSRLASMVSLAKCAAVIGEGGTLDIGRQLQLALGSDWQEVLGAPFPIMYHQSEGAADQRSGGEANALFAYILFTSGSTGAPKGIGITPTNLGAYLDHATSVFGVQPGDRSSQMFELTFDLSIHDLFVTWLGGGLLCVPPARAVMAPARFIIDEGITHWFSVPSTAAMLSKFRMLREGAFPTLKQSLFCGESLPHSIAAQWQKAAPNSTIWNLYGPTEATIAITAHAWTHDLQPDVVPIGIPFPGQRVRVVSGEAEVAAGMAGELCLSGSQVAPGYLSNAVRTAESFVRSARSPETETWYRTGDLVRQDELGVLHYVGRLDSQIQLHGHRVELGEIEGAIRSVTDGKMCAVIPWPPEQPNVESIVAFIEGIGSDEDASKLRQATASLLPDYMVPARIIFVAAMPLNSNGKLDRRALSSFI
jgi:amino acid adenylation domain-containing protein